MFKIDIENISVETRTIMTAVSFTSWGSIGGWSGSNVLSFRSADM